MAALPPRGLKSILQKLPTDIVILSSLRTPFTRAKKGGLKDAYPEELLAATLSATLSRFPSIPASTIDDISVGTVLQELGGAKAGRMASLHAGFPASTSFHTINRQCSSGLAAITSIAHAISVGAIDAGIGAGMESMSRNYASRAIPTVLWPTLPSSPNADARDCIMPMGLTSEAVAAKYSISRTDQDAFAARSHACAHLARESGLLAAEIIPVTTQTLDPQSPDALPTTITITADDGIRPSTTSSSLSTLKPAFSPTGTSTAGNSSQTTDGASATLLMRRSTATSLNLASQILGKWVATRTAGCPPSLMGIGPALAIPKLLSSLSLSPADIDIWEINEAFASQALYCIRDLGLENMLEEKVNVNGGAIALGHPLGATGGRVVATALAEMGRREVQLGVVSMCIGTGMGMASLIVREFPGDILSS